MKLALRSIGLAGALVFGLAFALTFLSPIHFERAARGFIESEIDRRMTQSLGDGQAARAVDHLARWHDRQLGAARARRDLVAAVVAEMQEADCACREFATVALGGAVDMVRSIEAGETYLRRIAQERYRELVSDLMRDLRIFSGTNLLAFLLLLGASWARPALSRPLIVPGILLAAAAMLSSAAYLFGQDWFFTLVYGQFTGFAYAVWMLLVFAFLCDIACFKARATSWLLGAIGVPC